MPIRLMMPSDAVEVATVHTLAWQQAYRGLISQDFLDSIDVNKRAEGWRKQAESAPPTNINLVAEEAGHIVGFACGLGNRFDKLPGCDSELWAIYVHPELQSKGIGHALFDHFKRELRAAGKKCFCVMALEGNVQARRFYERQGGVLSSETKDINIAEQKFFEVAYEFDL